MTKDITKSFEKYIAFFLGEKDSFGILERQIKNDENLIDRKNMNGHVTASGLVISEKGEALLIFHKANQMWHQPGGHVDSTDKDLLSAAKREIEEETSLVGIKLHPWHKDHPFPLDIDTHNIKPRPEKSEGEHVHHDFLYLFEAEKLEPTVQASEIEKAKWVSPSREIETAHQTMKSFAKMIQYGIIAA